MAANVKLTGTAAWSKLKLARAGSHRRREPEAATPRLSQRETAQTQQRLLPAPTLLPLPKPRMPIARLKSRRKTGGPERRSPNPAVLLWLRVWHQAQSPKRVQLATVKRMWAQMLKTRTSQPRRIEMALQRPELPRVPMVAPQKLAPRRTLTQMRAAVARIAWKPPKQLEV